MKMKSLMFAICVVYALCLVTKFVDIVLYIFGISFVTNIYVIVFMLFSLLIIPTFVKKLAYTMYKTEVKFGVYSYLIPLTFFLDDAFLAYQNYL
jgi:hypothetical protein